MEDNIYIKVIEAWLSFNQGFRQEDIENKINASESDKKTIKKLFNLSYHNYFYWKYHKTPLIVHVEKPQEINCNYIISYEASFDFYDYKELQQARENAKSARFWSIVALTFSAISLIVATSLTYHYWEKQLTTPIMLSWTQIEELKISNNEIGDKIENTNNKLNDTNQYLDDIDTKINNLKK